LEPATREGNDHAPWKYLQTEEMTIKPARKNRPAEQSETAPHSSHLAIFIYGLTGGGATRRALTLAREFAARGHRVDFVVVSGDGPLAKDFPPDVNLVILDSGAIRAARRLSWRSRRNQLNLCVPALARYLRRERPDVLLSAANHAHMTAVWARRLARAPVPLVLRISNHLTQSHAGVGRRPRPIRLRMARHLYAWADAVITVSLSIGEDLSEHTALLPDRIFTIYNPMFAPEQLLQATTPLAHPWFAADQVPVILGAGRLAPQKDFPTLLQAFALLRRECRAHLVILGEGKKRTQLEAMARELGISDEVDFPGFVDNPYPWMAGASVFVLSSAWEGSPGVLIEAMACGCPVVSTDCPSGPDEILQHGTYGKLVPVGQAPALAAAILSTLNTPADATLLQQRAAEFSVDRAVDRYLEVLLKISGSATPG
jgi:glycosyltransferase involved in cell wall biosynthesis